MMPSTPRIATAHQFAASTELNGSGVAAKDRALWVFSVIANLFRLRERIFFTEPNDVAKSGSEILRRSGKSRLDGYQYFRGVTCAEFCRASNSATILRRRRARNFFAGPNGVAKGGHRLCRA
jgi:hypothetical protein